MESGGTEVCSECPGDKLDLFLATLRGQQMQIVIDADRDIQAGLTYGPGDLTYTETLLLRVLIAERDAFTEEKMKESQQRKK